MTKLKRIDMNGRRQFGRIEYKDEVIRTLSKSFTTFTVGKVFRIDKKFTQAIVIFLQINKYMKNVYKSEKKTAEQKKIKSVEINIFHRRLFDIRTKIFTSHRHRCKISFNAFKLILVWKKEHTRTVKACWWS